MTQEPDYKALWEAEKARADRLQEQLNSVRDQRESIFENAGDSIFIVDLMDYEIVDANEHASRRLGYTHHELISMSIDDIEVYTDSEMTGNYGWESDVSGTRFYECHHRRRDGTLMPVEVSSRIVAFSQREVVLMFVRNIEVRKQLIDREFQLALEQARVKLLATFIQNAGHEFRTPLSKITTSTYLLAKLDDPTQRAEKVTMIDTQVDYITRLVNRLLLIAKLESDNLADTEALSVEQMLTALCDQYRATHPHHALSATIPAELPPVSGDPKYIHIALSQLLDNAYQFTPEQGTIHVSATAPEDVVQIEIIDSGTGIAPEDFDHIFETFWRKDKAHSTPSFGLGLSIAQKIIDKHGGTLTIESVSGQGTTARVTFLRTDKG